MIDFMRIAEDLYVVYLNGTRITPEPLRKEELFNALVDLQLSDDEMLFVDRFYGEGKP